MDHLLFNSFSSSLLLLPKFVSGLHQFASNPYLESALTICANTGSAHAVCVSPLALLPGTYLQQSDSTEFARPVASSDTTLDGSAPSKGIDQETPGSQLTGAATRWLSAQTRKITTDGTGKNTSNAYSASEGSSLSSAPEGRCTSTVASPKLRRSLRIQNLQATAGGSAQSRVPKYRAKCQIKRKVSSPASHPSLQQALLAVATVGLPITMDLVRQLSQAASPYHCLKCAGHTDTAFLETAL